MREGKIPVDWFAGRWRRPTAPMAISIRCRTGSRMCGPGPSWRTDRTGLPIRSIGRPSRAASRTSSRMRLHERLTERFVDRRTSVLMRRLRENTTLETEIKKTGEVVVEGHVDRPARRLHVCRRCVGGRLGGEGVAGGVAQRARRRDRRARHQGVAGAGARIRARHRRHAALDRRAGRQADCGRRRAASARARDRRRAAHRRLARRRCRRGSISGSRRTSSGCSGRCSRLPRPRT